jgi:hypothetical protein
MQIRRPLAALLTALALAAGGGALSACSSPTSSHTGTPADKTTSVPTGSTGASVPDNSNRETTTGGASGANG